MRSALRSFAERVALARFRASRSCFTSCFGISGDRGWVLDLRLREQEGLEEARGRVRVEQSQFGERFRGGLVSKAHRLCVSLNSRRESNKEADESPGGYPRRSQRASNACGTAHIAGQCEKSR